MQALIIDFNDSFTYNIASELALMGGRVKVVAFDCLKNLNPLELKFDAVVWGPGPGHVSEYYDEIKPWIDFFFSRQIRQMGVCLGHQLMGHYLGLRIVPCSQALHGQAVDIGLNKSWKLFFQTNQNKITVQRYNSLAVKTLKSFNNEQQDFLLYKNEVMAMRGEHYFSYQFHPESVGTNYPKMFFFPLFGKSL